jgi:hypothetical protein
MALAIVGAPDSTAMVLSKVLLAAFELAVWCAITVLVVTVMHRAS